MKRASITEAKNGLSALIDGLGRGAGVLIVDRGRPVARLEPVSSVPDVLEDGRLMRLVRDEALAEDLLSDVFLDVWRQAASFKGRSSVSTWLLAIARYKALSAQRRRPDAELDETIASTVADPADDPEVVLQKKDRSERLRHSLERLSPEHGEVIDLVYYHGKSVKDAAEIIGISEATAKTRMFYARRKLADLVAPA